MTYPLNRTPLETEGAERADPSGIKPSAWAYSEQRSIDLVLRFGLAVTTVVTLASVVFLAVVHVDDRYNVNHVSGTWMALARDLADGELYRPFFENGYYGLSAYMPLQIVVNTGAALVTGEYLVSAKLVAYASGLAVVALLLVGLRLLECPRLLSLGLVAALLATNAGMLAATGIHGDALPLALQLGALTLVLHSVSRRAIVAAAALCALAVLAKFTSIWALLAIALWLSFRERGRLGPFAVTFTGTALSGVAIFEIASDGRMSDNFAEVFAPGGSASEGSALAGLSTFFELGVNNLGAVWLLLPFATLALLQAAGRRSLTLPQVALVCALPITVVVLGNPGSDFNHLVDIGALVALVVGEYLVLATRSGERATAVPALVCVALIIGIAQSYRVTLKPDIAHAAKVAAGREQSVYSTSWLDPVVGPNDSVLSEDPAVPIFRGEKPLLLDGLGLRRLSNRHAELLEDLISRLDAREFDRVVLTHEVENDEWYTDLSLGLAVRDAIARNYSLLGETPVSLTETYWVYTRRSTASPAP